jgi:hypothetical protein
MRTCTFDVSEKDIGTHCGEGSASPELRWVQYFKPIPPLEI